MIVDPEALADRLRHALKIRGKSISELQRVLAEENVPGSSYSMVHKYLAGKSVPPLEFVVACSRLIPCNLEWLIADTGLASAGEHSMEGALDVAVLTALYNRAPHLAEELDYAAYVEVVQVARVIADETFVAPWSNLPNAVENGLFDPETGRLSPDLAAFVEKIAETVIHALMTPLDVIGIHFVAQGQFSQYIGMTAHALRAAITYDYMGWKDVRAQAEAYGLTPPVRLKGAEGGLSRTWTMSKAVLDGDFPSMERVLQEARKKLVSAMASQEEAKRRIQSRDQVNTPRPPSDHAHHHGT